jgi:hypothetical protein
MLGPEGLGEVCLLFPEFIVCHDSWARAFGIYVNFEVCVFKFKVVEV